MKQSPKCIQKRDRKGQDIPTAKLAHGKICKSLIFNMQLF